MPDDAPAPIGAAVDAYSPGGVRCGTYVVGQAGAYGLMAVYADDPGTSREDGAHAGETLRFFVDGMPAAPLGPAAPVWTVDGDVRQLNLHAGPIVHRTIFLVPGWNLISFDIMPSRFDVAGALESIAGAYSAVMTSDCAGGAQSYYPDLPPQINTLSRMDAWHGYWIKMTREAHLVVAGVEVPDDTPQALCAGYNLVGYLPAGSLPVPDALVSLGGRVQNVLGFDPLVGGQSYYPDLPEINTLTQLQPGRGYWIRLHEAGTLVYPY